MDGEQTQYIWGVIDMVPDTDFPDIRHKAAVHSNQGSCMVIPREDDKVRLYIQLAGSDVIDQDTGRVNKSKTGPRELLDVARKSFRPFTFKDPEVFDWWTIYISKFMFRVIWTEVDRSYSRTKGGVEILCARTGVYRG